MSWITGVVARYQWLTPVILATQETDQKDSVWSQLREKFVRLYLKKKKKAHHKKELVEWLKV
jgi:hypothetical protein